MKPILTNGDLIDVLSVYDRDLPLQLRVNETREKIYEIGTDECIRKVSYGGISKMPPFLEIVLLEPYEKPKGI